VSYEIGRDIEALYQRLTNLESQLKSSKGKPCNCSDQEKIEIPSVPKKGIRMQSLNISETHKMKIISFIAGGEMDNALIADPNKTYIKVENNIKYMVHIHPSSEKFDIGSLFTEDKMMAGLGFGRCKCYKWGNWKCHSTRYDKDCCDKNSYMNGADEHCDLTCSSYVAIWYIECGKCGQPEDC
jgi:hypothetical protein